MSSASELLRVSAHRATALPSAPWIMFQRWHDLLFAHWSVPAARLRALVPSELELDLHEGRAWLGVVPFRMSAVRLRALPPFPGVSAFPELNVRTYVRHGEHRGVWFFSLDATSSLAVRAARLGFSLPYYDARMSLVQHGGEIRYESQRTHRGAPSAELAARYAPRGPVELARPGSLEHFLSERYCLFARTRAGRLMRGDIHHAPWPLQPAEAGFARCTMAVPLGIELAGPPEHLAFARALDVLIWAPRKLASRARDDANRESALPLP